MNGFADSRRDAPDDQAMGLRRMFAGRVLHLLPLAANPFVPAAGALLECVTAALVARGQGVLVVDAASSAPPARETALIDLASCIEPLAGQVCYLAARGLPMAHVDSHGSAGSLLDAAAAAAPQADTLLLHADAQDLARLLKHRAVRPLLLASDRPPAVKHAYAACKLLALRCGLTSFDLLLAGRAGSRRMSHIAGSLAGCADTFLGAVLHDWAVVDALFDPAAARDPGLGRLLAAQLAQDQGPVAGWSVRRRPPARLAPPAPTI